MTLQAVKDFISARPRVQATIYLGLAVLVVAVGLWVWVNFPSSSSPRSAPGEQAIQQDATEHAATADTHVASGKEKVSRAIENAAKADEHRARRRAIHIEANQQRARIDALPDTALPAEYFRSVDRARAAIERADRERGADAGSNSPAN